jgi:hypothetical protein
VTCEHHLDIQRAQTERAQDFVPKEDKCKTCKKEYLVETYGQKNCEPCRAKVRDKTKMKNAKQRTRRKLRAQAMAEEAAATDAAAANFADAHTNGQELGAVPALSWRCPLRPPRERSPDKDIVSAVVLALHAAENVFPSGFVKYILFTPTPLDARNLPSGMRNVHLRCALRTFLDCFLCAFHSFARASATTHTFPTFQGNERAAVLQTSRGRRRGSRSRSVKRPG